MGETDRTKRQITREQLEAWLLGYREGDLAAFERLYDGMSRIVAAALGKIVPRAEVSDLLQETFLKIHRHIRSYREGGNPLSWILTIAQNVAFDHLAAARKRYTALVDMRVEAERTAPLAQPNDGAAGATPFDLDEVLGRLSPEDRTLVSERFNDELSFAVMAARRNIPEATLRQRLSRVIRGLRKSVES